MTVSLEDRLENHSYNIDILRFIAAICVIFTHSYALTINSGDPLERLNGGYCTALSGFAVAVFFFISGLYVTKSLEHSDSIGEFLLKRCKRIFPQMIALSLVTVFVLGPILTSLPLKAYFTSKQTYMYLLNSVLIPVHDLPGVFTNNPYLPTVNGALWTMPYEFASYLLLAFMAFFSRLIKKNRKVLDTVVLILLMFIYFYMAYISKNPGWVVRIRPVVFFFEGVLFHDLRSKIKLNTAMGLLSIAILAGLAFMPLFAAAMIILFPYFILSVALGTPQIRKAPQIFSSSYEMYLVGFPIQQTLVYYIRNMTPLANWLIAVPLDVVIGYVFYKFMKRIVK